MHAYMEELMFSFSKYLLKLHEYLDTNTPVSAKGWRTKLQAFSLYDTSEMLVWGLT